MGRVAAAALVCWLAVWAGPAAVCGQDDRPDSVAVAWERDVGQQRSWLGRVLHRYFGRAPRTGSELAGRAERLVDRYLPYAGRRIGVVIVYPVLRFDEVLGDSSQAARGGLERFATPLWSYTRESVVRQYLLFAGGDRLDPTRLADSERLLRQLEYVNDVRLVVVPIGDQDDEVAVVVEIMDRWPFGITGNIITRDRYDAGLYWTNGLGLGIRFDNRVLVHRAREPEVGYRGTLGKENLFGSFVDASLEYEDSWRRLSRVMRVERGLAHRDVNVVGGYFREDTDDRDNDGVPRAFVRNDAWLGRVFQLEAPHDRPPAQAQAQRRLLTPAVAWVRYDFRDRPTVTPDSQRAYHDRRTWMASLTYENLTDYRTSYLFRMGETEDVPGGFAAKLTGGYEQGEFLRRSLVAAETGAIGIADGGEAAWFYLGAGGYVRNLAFEDGVFDGRAGYITPLLGRGSWRHRLYSRLNYVLGINRTAGSDLVLGDRTGLRDLSNSKVRGTQRLLLRLESRHFTPWRLFGFDTMLFWFGDAGMVAGENDPLLQQKIYASLGVGVRVSNPDLVLPTFELRVGVLSNVEGGGFGLSFDLGNMAYPGIDRIGQRPGTVAYR